MRTVGFGPFATGVAQRLNAGPPSAGEETMSALVWIGIVLLVLWLILWLGFHIVVWAVHLLIIAAVILIVWGLVKRGANAVRDRV
jgi:LPXTG-motif cell wall-anchored protein